jgi:hypothetical protein
MIGLLIVLVGLGFCQALPFRPVVIQDTTVLRWVLQPEAQSGELPAGSWSMVPSGDSSNQLIILKNGTEYKRLSENLSIQFMAANSSLFKDQLTPHEVTWRAALESQEPVWNWVFTEPFDKIDGEWFQQVEGLEMERGILSSRGGRWWIRDYWRFEASKIVGKFRAEASLQMFNDYMNIQKELRTFYGSSNFSDYSWGASISWLGATYSFQQAPWVLPEYFWLEKYPDSLFLAATQEEQDSTGGQVISMFKNGISNSHTGNMVHSLDFRLWYFRYKALMDADMYTATVHRFGFEDVPSAFGSWGAFAVNSGDIWVPGFWVEMGPAFTLKVPFLSTWNQGSWFPVRFEMMYENTTHFRIAFNTRIRLGAK